MNWRVHLGLFLLADSFKSVRDLVRIRREGKEYVMQDGDVVEFRFSVTGQQEPPIVFDNRPKNIFNV